MKVLVTGSRDWAHKGIVRRVLQQSGATTVIHGDARGADGIAKWIARSLGVTERGYPAKWDLYRRAAGPIRNQEMLDKEHLPGDPIERCLAFPLAQSVGTWDMVERCRKVGIPVTIINLEEQ